MKILNLAQLRELDTVTLEKQNLTRLKLMERAARGAYDAMAQELYGAGPVHIFCGPGYNGADGLLIARQLLEAGKTPIVYILAGETYPEEYNALTGQLFERGVDMHWLRVSEDIPTLEGWDFAIDALYGIGVTRPLTGLAAELIARINKAQPYVIAVDIPSGLPAEGNWQPDWPVLKATTTYTFQVPKLALLLPDTGALAGTWFTIDLELDEDYQESADGKLMFLQEDEIALLALPERPRFSHKGTFGHALLAGGSYGKCGAMLLAAEACIRSGVGLTTVAVPECGLVPMQTAVPEAMVAPCANVRTLDSLPEILGETYATIGIGPGMGTASETVAMLDALLEAATLLPFPTLVLDADALNIIADKGWQKRIPSGSILTPHPGELDKLTPGATTSYERLIKAQQLAENTQSVVVLKGAYTATMNAEGITAFNPSGNAGMATGGMGDVLTGLITGLRAQGVDSSHAACLGVYLHGLAGDLAQERVGMEALTAGTLTKYLGRAFMEMNEAAEDEIPF
jgi:ADP-dependent NAD(P)H-hydrate dehydratase / NAD(P)H-hydrate epimerase